MLALYVVAFAAAETALLMLSPGGWNIDASRAKAVSINMAYYHHRALQYVIAHGGSSFSGVVPTAALALPTWYNQILPWTTSASGGAVMTCTLTTTVAIVPGLVVSALVDELDDDAGAGQAVGANFQSATANLTVPMPLACPNTYPVFYSRVS